METAALVFKEIRHYDLFRFGAGGSVLAILSQLIYNPNFMLTTIATLSGIAVAGLSAYKVFLEIEIKKEELKGLRDLHDINNNK